METQEEQRAEAATALKQIADSRAALAERLMSPWWYWPAFGVWFGGFTATQTQELGNWVRVATVLAFMLGFQCLIRAYRKATGFWVSRPHRPQSSRAWRWLIAFALVAVALFLAGVALQAAWGWVGPVLVGIVTVPVVTVIGRRLDAAVRAEMRGRA